MNRSHHATRDRQGLVVFDSPNAGRIQPARPRVTPQRARLQRVARGADEEFQRLAQTVRASWPASHQLPFGLTSRVLLVVGAVHGEGASLVARNLALKLAEGGNRRVALVDANLRTPSQHEAFGVTRTQGLVEVARGRMGLNSALHGGSNPGLVLLSSGAPSSSPPGLLAAGRTRQLFAELGARFDWVVVDGPPATVYSDSAILARWSDAALLVVKADGTRREVVKHARRTLDEAGTRVLGAVLNRRHFHIPDWIYRRLS